MTNDEYAAIIRSMIEHENTLLNHRMSWMWTLQGLLLAAAGIMWKIHYLIVLLICTFGLMSCASFGASFHAALRAIRSLIEDWENRISGEGIYDGPRVIGSPGVQPLLSKLYPWNVLPWLMAAVWILLAIGKVALDDSVL